MTNEYYLNVPTQLYGQLEFTITCKRATQTIRLFSRTGQISWFGPAHPISGTKITMSDVIKMRLNNKLTALQYDQIMKFMGVCGEIQTR